MDRLPSSQWDFVGSLSVEDRCLASWEQLAIGGRLGDALLLEIEDPPSRFSTEIAERIDGNRARLIDLSRRFSMPAVVSFPLFARSEDLVAQLRTFTQESSGSLVVDISSLPKRFFFPALRLLLDDPTVQDLVVTYTLANRYGADELAEDAEPWAHIPLFPGERSGRVGGVVVSVGFQALNLPPLGDQQFSDARFLLLVPIAGQAPEHHRVWEFLKSFERDHMGRPRSTKWTDWKDVPETFKHIQSFATSGDSPPLFAPYGPKPISLAMLLFCQSTGAGVFYTQPKIYNPDYTLGVRSDRGRPLTYGYLVKARGEKLYSP